MLRAADGLTLLAQSAFFRHSDFGRLPLALSEFDVAGGVERVEGMEALP